MKYIEFKKLFYRMNKFLTSQDIIHIISQMMDEKVENRLHVQLIYIYLYDLLPIP